MVDSFYLNLAVQKAWNYQCQTLPNPAVGAVALDETGAILSIQAHKEAGQPHAEVLALQESYYRLSNDSSILKFTESKDIHDFLIQNGKTLFKGISLYVTLEPCTHMGKTPSCAKLLQTLEVKRVIIGAKDCNEIASGGADSLKNAGIEVIKAWEEKSLFTSHENSKSLLIPFQNLQNKGYFTLFKYASRLDGSIDGGQISSKETQSFMHNLRAKVDSLLISGKSVRIDLPRLDCRFSTLEEKNPPPIKILSRSLDIPQNAPLFNIPNRKVEIIQKIENFKGFVMCEGGKELFNSLSDKIDMALLFLNPSLQSDFTLRMQQKKRFKILHSQTIGEDLALWLLPHS